MTETDNDALADGDGLARDQYQTLRGTTYRRVHDAILADIVKGSFTPGARLKIADLCRRYGLSPMPIREALQQLQGEGIVVMEPNKGAKVRTIDRNFIADIYDVRGALYAIVYRDVIATADSAFDDRLVAIQQGFDQMMEAGDTRACNAQNRLLHDTIQARCKNREVSDLMQRYGNLTSSLRDALGFNIDRLREISQEHWAIIEAIRARDFPRALEAAQHHVRQALINMSRNFDNQP
jgi:DNA-binding GntR family transcriptional regulator